MDKKQSHLYTPTHFKKLYIKVCLIAWFNFSVLSNVLLFLSLQMVQNIHNKAAPQAFSSSFQQKIYTISKRHVSLRNASPTLFQKEQKSCHKIVAFYSNGGRRDQLFLLPLLLCTDSISSISSTPSFRTNPRLVSSLE